MRKLFLLCYLLSSVTLAATPQKLTVILDWFPNVDHASLVIAKYQGFFQEQDLDVELIGPADPTDAPKLVAAKKADLGISYQPELIEYVDRGLPLIRIGTLIDKPLDCVVALEESGIQTFADLKGKRIGTSTSGMTDLMLKVMLQNAHLHEKDVELINVRYNLTQALLSRQVDAITGVMRNVEIPQLELKGQKLITFFPEDHGIPNYSVLVFIAHKDNSQDERYPRFLAAIKKATHYLETHPADAWALFVKYYPETNNAVNRTAWFATITYFAKDPSHLNHEEWKRFAQFMFQHQMIKKVEPVSAYAVALNLR